MEIYKKLFKLGKPAFFVVETDVDTFANLYVTLLNERPESVIRMVRGNKSLTTKEFFSEIAAALQFPYYFGENGAAFNDCINDLEWLKGDAYLIMVDDAHLMLSDAHPEHFTSLMRILADANEAWLTPNTYFPRDREPTAFHVLFRCPETQLEGFLQRFSGLDQKPIQLSTN
ncbi:MAG: barstar family protein [Anaerolineae bacterium]|nr:barstar family protein [Anaerolineae bacterium]